MVALLRPRTIPSSPTISRRYIFCGGKLWYLSVILSISASLAVPNPIPSTNCDAPSTLTNHTFSSFHPGTDLHALRILTSTDVVIFSPQFRCGRPQRMRKSWRMRVGTNRYIISIGSRGSVRFRASFVIRKYMLKNLRRRSDFFLHCIA